MTIKQRKNALIHWIKHLEDEHVIDQLEGIRENSLDALPREIVQLLKISASEKTKDCVEHITAQDILEMDEE